MSKNKKILMVLIVACVLMVLTGVGIFTLINSQKVTIYSFNADYKAGQPITESMLTPIQVDKKIVEANRTGDVSTYFITSKNFKQVTSSGDYLRSDVKQNQLLTKSLTVTNSGNQIEMSMATDKTALTLSVDSITGVTSDLMAGSYVNIYCGSTKEGAVPQVYERMKILEITKNDTNELSSVTIECTKDEGINISSYAQNGYIYMALINITGYQSGTTTNTQSTTK